MDVFDEGICDDILPEDWAKVERSRRALGYREGVAEGQETSLQEGFNAGFSQGTVTRFSYSFVKGVVNALIGNLQTRDQEPETAEDTSSAVISQLETILSDLDTLQERQRVGPGPDDGGGGGSRSTSDFPTGTETKSHQQETGHDCCQEANGASCLDSESSLSNQFAASCTCSSKEARQDEQKELTSGETTNKGIAASNVPSQGEVSDKLRNYKRGEKQPFYSQNHAMQKIIDRLKPHLEQMGCEDVLKVSHPFLKCE